MNIFKIATKSLVSVALLLIALTVGCKGGQDPILGSGLPDVVSFVITPAQASIPINGAQQYTAIQTFADGSTRDVTATSAWTSADLTGGPGVATILQTGLATGKAMGQSTITAKYLDRTGTALLTVNSATSVSFVVTPASASVPVTGTQQFTAIETFSDGTTINRTAASTWTAVNVPLGGAAIAAVLPSGLATGLVIGQSDITATFGTQTAKGRLTVNAATSVSFKVTPALASVPVTGTQQYTAIETFSDGTTIDRTAASNWTAVNVPLGGLAVASVTSTLPIKGLATGLIFGQSDITATFGTMTAKGRLTVNAAVSIAFVVTPAVATVPITGTQQYVANEIFSDGTTIDRTAASDWTSVNVPLGGPAVATVSSTVPTKGLATGNVIGQSDITATFGSQTATGRLSVTAATSVAFVVTPAVATVPITGTQQYTAVETFDDGTTIDRTAASTWTAVNVPAGGPAVATVSSTVPTKGLATGNVAGQATITATFGLKVATAILNVKPATSVSFKVTPAQATVPVGGTQQYTALETFDDGTTIDRTAASNWTTVNVPTGGPLVATVSSTLPTKGLATGAVMGQSDITATFGAVSAKGRLTVTAVAPPPPSPLKTAATYGLIAASAMTISSVPTTHIYGDVALTNNDSFVGFAFGGTIPLPTSPYVTPRTIPGINSTVRGSVAAAAQAKIDLAAAYADLSSRTPTLTYGAGATQLSTGVPLTPGVYRAGAALAGDTFALNNTNGPLVLDALGNPNAVFVFQASDITTTTGSVLLQGGAKPNNVYWVMTATATIGNGSGTVFQGTVVAGLSITVDGSNVQGRMLAGASGTGALTIGPTGSVLTVPVP